MLGVAVVDAGPGGDAAVRAVIDGDRVELHARLSVVYPAPIRATAAQARTGCVLVLTGLVVTKVDIVVTALPGAAATRRVQ